MPIARGPAAAQIAAAHAADAVAVDGAVALGAGYGDDTPATLGLLAHELTHVARDRAPRFVPPLARAAPRPADEEQLATAAERAGRAAARSSADASAHGPASQAQDAPGQPARGLWAGLPAPWEALPAWMDGPPAPPGPPPAPQAPPTPPTSSIGAAPLPHSGWPAGDLAPRPAAPNAPGAAVWMDAQGTPHPAPPSAGAAPAPFAPAPEAPRRPFEPVPVAPTAPLAPASGASSVPEVTTGPPASPGREGTPGAAPRRPPAPPARPMEEAAPGQPTPNHQPVQRAPRVVAAPSRATPAQPSRDTPASAPPTWPAQAQPAVHRAGQDRPLAEAPPDHAPVGPPAPEAPPPDLDELARQVYAVLKGRLAAELRRRG